MRLWSLLALASSRDLIASSFAMPGAFGQVFASLPDLRFSELQPSCSLSVVAALRFLIASFVLPWD
jgi:hypothetical protein